MKQSVQLLFYSHSSAATEHFSKSIGHQLRGGEVLQLIGDVGAGKTTFVRGLAQGLGSTDRVSSPTFTISNVYNSPNLSLHHYDFYRIEDVEIMKQELIEVIANPRNITVLEWSAPVSQVLPTDCISIQLQTTEENSRTLDCDIPQKYNYLGLAV